MTACTRPSQAQATQDPKMKEGKSHPEPRSHLQKIASERRKISFLQWSDVGCINHTACSGEVGQHKLHAGFIVITVCFLFFVFFYCVREKEHEGGGQGNREELGRTEGWGRIL